MRFFDTHCHLDDEQFDPIRDEVVQRAEAAGLSHVIAVGTTAPSSQVCIRLAASYPVVRASVGIQPNYVAEAAEGDWQRIVEMVAQPGVVALGETGLDRYWDHTPFAAQQDYFDRHIQLSQQTDLPFIVHMRDCEADILEQLRAARRQGALSGVMHSFTGSADTAAECIELGLYVSFAGMVTYKKSDALRAVAAEIPADRLLIETDAPYLSPHPKRGQRPNEPALVRHTAECLADARGVTVEQLAERTNDNACRLFRIQ